MTAPKLFILPADRAPHTMLPEEPRRPLQKMRLYDANGTEFVNIESASSQSEPSGVASIFTIQMRLLPFDVVVLDAPPAALRDRLKQLAESWCAESTGSTSDKESLAAETAREVCAEQLEAVLAEFNRAT